MDARAGALREEGAVLVIVVLLMLATLGLGHSIFLSARYELLATRAGARQLGARAAAEARQIAVVSVPSRPAAGSRTKTSALALALQLFRTGRRLRIRAPRVGSPGNEAKLPGGQANS